MGVVNTVICLIVGLIDFCVRVLYYNRIHEIEAEEKLSLLLGSWFPIIIPFY